jgi:hypothetical protein
MPRVAVVALVVVVCVGGVGMMKADDGTARTVCSGAAIFALVGLCGLTAAGKRK